MATPERTRAWVQLVRDARDLGELEAHLADAHGRVSDIALGYADELLVDIDAGDGREWLLGTQASDWRLTDAAIGMDSRNENSIPPLAGAQVDEIRVEPDLDLVVRLSDGRTLLVEAKSFEPAGENDPPYWELFSPEGLVFSAGPGLRWSATPADLPELNVPRQRVIWPRYTTSTRKALAVQVGLTLVAFALALAAIVADASEASSVAVALVALVALVGLVAQLRARTDDVDPASIRDASVAERDRPSRPQRRGTGWF
jgi:hypothetical protein